MALLKIIRKQQKGFTPIKSGFTLIELLIVIAIISALAITVFVALDPGKRIKDARDARRVTDADTILTAVHAYIVDNKGTLPSSLSPAPFAETQLGNGGASGCAISSGGCSTGAACVDLASDIPPYLKSNPIDPEGGITYTAAKTGYSVSVDSNNVVTVKACGAQNANISVSR